MRCPNICRRLIKPQHKALFFRRQSRTPSALEPRFARLKIFVFDAYGTLFDVNSAVARHREEVGPQADRLSELWRAKQLEYTWVRSLMNSYRDFAVITADALSFAAEKIGGLSSELRAKFSMLTGSRRVCRRWPALSGLKQLGLQTAILSNGTMAMLERPARCPA